VSCRKTADPINMQFGVKTRVVPGNHMLVGGSDAPWEGRILGASSPPPLKCIVTASPSKTGGANVCSRSDVWKSVVVANTNVGPARLAFYGPTWTHNTEARHLNGSAAFVPKLNCSSAVKHMEWIYARHWPSVRRLSMMWHVLTSFSCYLGLHV